MATGAYLNGFLIAPTPGLAAGVPGDHLLPQGARGGRDVAPLTAGPLTSARPIAVRNVAQTGARLHSFMDDWYGRIHVLPQVLDFGAVGGGATRTARLWNAYLTPSVIDGVTRDQDDNLLLGGAEPLTELGALQQLVLTVAPEEDGPALIETTYTFAFDGRPDTPTLTVLGRRARVWPFAPDWADPVEVGLEFRTDIVRSRDGSEQRRALRQTPRRTLGYGMVLNQREMRTFDQVLSRWQARPWVLGDPTRSTLCPDGAPVGTDQIVVDEVPGWLAVGITLMVGDQIAAVAEIEERTVTLDAPLSATVSAGARVAPALSGRLDGTMTARHLTSAATRLDINFVVEPGSEAEDAGAPGYLIHDGREVFAKRPNWAEGIDGAYAWPVEQIDPGFGRIATYVPGKLGSLTRRADFIGATAADADTLTQFFSRQRGQVGEFLMPTWLNDLPPKFDLLTGVAHIRVEGTEVFEAFANSLDRKAVSVLMNDGRLIFRSVTGITAVVDSDGEDSLVSLDAPWLTDLPLDEILMVSWLPVARMAGDALTVEWLTDQVVQTSMSIQTLEALAPEDPIADYDGAAQWVLEVWGGGAGIPLLADVDYLTNIHWPSLFFDPEAWSWHNRPIVGNLGGLLNQYHEVTT